MFPDAKNISLNTHTNTQNKWPLRCSDFLGDEAGTADMTFFVWLSESVDIVVTGEISVLWVEIANGVVCVVGGGMRGCCRVWLLSSDF